MAVRNLDQRELEERHTAILQRLDSPAVHRTYDHEAATGEGVRLARICQFAIDHCSDLRTFELCTQWHKDMAELIRRMRDHWTRDEKASLLSLLDRFEEVLQHLLQPHATASVYAPAARQIENHTRAAELFVSGTNFSPDLRKQKLTLQYDVRGRRSTGMHMRLGQGW